MERRQPRLRAPCDLNRPAHQRPDVELRDAEAHRVRPGGQLPAPASDYADPTFYWQGVEMTVNARMNNGLTLQGGFTTGGGVRDLCEVAAQLPELYQAGGLLVNRDVDACRVEEPWLWAWRGLANYVVPKIDVQVSGIMRSMANVAATNDPASNGLSQSANYFEPAANIVAQLGRPVAGNPSQVTLDLTAQRGGEVHGAA